MLAGLARLFYWVGASFIFLDDTGIGSLTAAPSDAFKDLDDSHCRGGCQSSGGKMPPGR